MDSEDKEEAEKTGAILVNLEKAMERVAETAVDALSLSTYHRRYALLIGAEGKELIEKLSVPVLYEKVLCKPYTPQRMKTPPKGNLGAPSHDTTAEEKKLKAKNIKVEGKDDEGQKVQTYVEKIKCDGDQITILDSEEESERETESPPNKKRRVRVQVKTKKEREEEEKTKMEERLRKQKEDEEASIAQQEEEITQQSHVEEQPPTGPVRFKTEPLDEEESVLKYVETSGATAGAAEKQNSGASVGTSAEDATAATATLQKLYRQLPKVN